MTITKKHDVVFFRPKKHDGQRKNTTGNEKTWRTSKKHDDMFFRHEKTWHRVF
jgi:hypothetical protein